jgi:hypothetical protein
MRKHDGNTGNSSVDNVVWDKENFKSCGHEQRTDRNGDGPSKYLSLGQLSVLNFRFFEFCHLHVSFDASYVFLTLEK